MTAAGRILSADLRRGGQRNERPRICGLAGRGERRSGPRKPARVEQIGQRPDHSRRTDLQHGGIADRLHAQLMNDNMLVNDEMHGLPTLRIRPLLYTGRILKIFIDCVGGADGIVRVRQIAGKERSRARIRFGIAGRRNLDRVSELNDRTRPDVDDFHISNDGRHKRELLR